MKHNSTKRVITMLLCMAMLLSVVPLTTYATIANWATENVTYNGTTFGTNGYYNVISQKDYTLVPGAATETEMVLNNASGTRRQVLHIIEVDPSNPDVSVLPGYYNIDKDVTDVNNQKAAGVTEVAKYYEEELGYNVVGAMNTDLYYEANAPRVLVYNGVDMRSGRSTSSVLCVYKNDQGEVSCDVKAYNASEITNELANGNAERGKLIHAVGVSFGMTVKDGELVSKTEERTSSAAARSMVGVKEDGTLVLCMNDGRGANNSVGFCNYELGESMLALGCKWAANCDGGGSSSFVTKRAGEDELTLRCVPCDGSERPTIHSVLIVSNVGKTGILNNVNIESDYDIYAPGTSFTFGAKAIDTHGYTMDMPEDATWALSDSSFGSIENGTFVSSGKLGTVKIQIISGGNVVGEKEITIANPTTLKFTQDSTVLPYGKNTTLSFTSLIGEAKVYLNESIFEFSLSNAAAGILNGLTFTATDDESVDGTTITAKYLPTGQELIYTITLGKGSEILYDFEDGDISAWKSTDDTIAWLTENGVSNPLGTLIDGGQISECCKTTTFLATRENGGQVHNGNNALGINFDMTQVPFNTWVYGILYNTNDGAVLRDVNNGKKATTIGMWMYVPENFHQTAGKMAFQLTAYVGFDGSKWQGSKANAVAANSGYWGTQFHFQYNGTNINGLTESQIPENRWIYVTADISGYDYVALVDPLNDVYRSPSFLRTYIKPDVCQQMTWYIDDITLDYSSAVDDRISPVISNPEYSTSDTNVTFNDGITITNSSAAFSATVSDDNSGIDPDTAAIYVDGTKVAKTELTGSTIHCSNVILYKGTHKIKFEIADKLGNYTTLTRTIVSECTDKVVDADRASVTLAGHNDSGETPMPGSVYYIDVNTNNRKQLDTAAFTLKLSSCNTWLLDQMESNGDYVVTYKINECRPNEVEFKVERSSKWTNSTSEDNWLFTIPVRVYNPELFGGSDGGEGAISGTRFSADLTVEIASCVLNGTYGCYDKLEVITGVRQVNRHEHTVVALEDKAATCTENGYTGRTYCEVCSSVADWGETIPTSGHDYRLVGDKFICSVCDDEYDYSNVTGLFTVSGKTYYAIGGNLVSGWQDIDGEYYFFHPTTKTTVDSLDNGYVTFNFEKNGKLVSGQWYNDGVGTKYYYGPDYYRCGAGNPYANSNWVVIDGKTYCFDRQGYRHVGLRVIINSNDPAKLCEFDENGVFLSDNVTTESGLFQCNGYKCYLKNGVPIQTGLIKIGKDYYYVDSSCTVITGTHYCTNMGNYGIPAGTYTFDENGVMLNPPVDELKNGPQSDGFFYLDGVRQNCYQLVEYNGEYYFISDGHKIAKNAKVYLSSAFVDGTQFTPGYYEFDSEGKMIIKNGPQSDGYFYLNGVRQDCYQLVEYNGDYYFINDGHKLAKNAKIYLGSEFVDGTPFMPGYYEFDSEGKLIIKNGPQSDGFFYLNGVRQNCYQLVEYNGDYYFINDGHKIAKSKKVYLSSAFVDGTQFTPGYYEFDSEGKMIIKNGPQSDGYFYLNGVRQDCYQLVEYNGYYYFISDGHKYTVSKTVYLNADFVNGTPFAPGYYTFDEDGKMQVPYTIEEGVFTSNNKLYYAKNGILQNGNGLVLINDDYYYVCNDATLATGTYPVTNTNGYVKSAYYTFGEDGVMQTDSSFVIGVRCARDIAYLNQTSNEVKVKKGLLIRGTELDGAYRNDVTEEYASYAINTLKNNYGINMDMDLRAQNDLTKDVFGESILHKYYNMAFYENIFTDDGKKAVKAVFEDLANRDNYPIYMHCTYGVDRTGTVCYLLEALLGFSDWNLSHDYCATIGSHEPSILKIKTGLADYAGNTRQEQVTSYLISCGLTQEQLNTICDIFLEN